MDDALRVDDNVNIVVIHSEQVVRLNDFQPLVHQSGRVNGDLLAHRPVRMRGGLGHSDLCDMEMRCVGIGTNLQL